MDQSNAIASPEKPRRSKIWRWVPLACVVVALLAAYAAGLAEYLSLERIVSYRDWLSEAVGQNPLAAALIYLFVYVAAVGLSFPGASVLTAAGGFMFGCVLGTLLAAVAATAGATIIFLIARTSLGDSLAEKAGPRLQKLRKGFADEAFAYLLALRLAPVFPFWIVNLAAALFGMNVAPYVLATAIGILPGTFVYSYVGQNLDSTLGGEKPIGLLLALALLAAMALIPVFMRRRRGATRSPTNLAKTHDRSSFPEICVIGAGSAGLTVAAAAAAFGVSVVLVEKGEMGGDCLNSGCVPSKALIAAAKHAQAAREAAPFGIRLPRAEVNFAAVHRHVHGVIAAIAPDDSVERFTGLGVRVIRATARFKDKRTVVAGDFEIRARRFVIATGSTPAIPPIADLKTVPYLTNETVFSLRRRPTHLLVIGGGPIGMEMAQAFRRLGSQVTVFQSGPALPHDDRELVAVLLHAIREEGVEIREGVTVSKVTRRNRGGVRATLSDGSWTDGSHILIAAGRRPTVAGLGLEQAGVAYDENGIRVNASLRTRNRRVYAIGDVTPGYRFTHWAGYQAGLVLRSILFRFGGRMKPDIVSWVTYTDPELAHVGLGEAEARRRYRSIRILRWPFSENDRAQTERATAGLVKVITTQGGRVLGAEILGRGAGELIGMWALAVTARMNVKSVLGVVLPYPTLSEAGKRAAVSFYTPKLRSALVRRTIRFLRVFG